jgi:hypothetical protein
MPNANAMPIDPGVTSKVATWVDDFLRREFCIPEHVSIAEGMDQAANKAADQIVIDRLVAGFPITLEPPEGVPAQSIFGTSTLSLSAIARTNSGVAE